MGQPDPPLYSAGQWCHVAQFSCSSTWFIFFSRPGPFDRAARVPQPPLPGAPPYYVVENQRAKNDRRNETQTKQRRAFIFERIELISAIPFLTELKILTSKRIGGIEFIYIVR